MNKEKLDGYFLNFFDHRSALSRLTRGYKKAHCLKTMQNVVWIICRRQVGHFWNSLDHRLALSSLTEGYTKLLYKK